MGGFYTIFWESSILTGTAREMVGQIKSLPCQHEGHSSVLEQLGYKAQGWHSCLEEEANSELPLARPDASASEAAQVCPHLPSHILAHGLHPTSFFLSLLEKYFIHMPFSMSLGSKNCHRYVPPSLFLQVWWNVWHQWDQDHSLSSAIPVQKWLSPLPPSSVFQRTHLSF